MFGSSNGSAQPGGPARPKLPAIVEKLNILLHISVVLVSLSIAFLLFDNSLFSWHPMFMSIGYLLFMTEGLLSAVMFRHLDGPERVSEEVVGTYQSDAPLVSAGNQHIGLPVHT